MAYEKGVGSLQLGEYYIASVETLWRVTKAQLDTQADDELVAEIERLIAKQNKSWSEVYSLERLIVPLMPELEINAFFRRRLALAKSIPLVSAQAHEDNWTATASESDPDERRAAKQAAYSVILDDLDWHYTSTRLNRAQRDKAAQRLWRVGLAILFLVALPWLIVSLVSILSAYAPSVKTMLVSALNFAPLFGVYTAMSFGLLGALFSRLNSFQSQVGVLTYAEITQAFKLRYLMIRFGFGMVGALILYYLIAGKFIEGDLFPTLSAAKFRPHSVELWGAKVKSIIPSADFAKLVVWSFIGGFSERLVPSILEKRAAQAGAEGGEEDR